ncbi:hypothetical protein JavanS176_0005 [Streptococcus satellite phage Javan176]|uniref:hypothetical protein n=1 Tax=Streptococcus entericus TaxID=155680 RepID=UPI00035EEC6F|nr:hypothetical protein [Streptococcus entericus]QBX07766.1 hypothetical protein JavanS176_0005 [Streptococcus satellite phage Javan176]
MKEDTLQHLARSGLIIFAKDGKIDTVKAPEFGEVVIKYKNAQPYDVAVTEHKKL